MAQGKWWLVMCTTFGTWLPGDPRGFQTWRGRQYIPPPKRYAKPGEPAYRAQDHASEYQTSSDALTQEPVRFDARQCAIAANAIIEEIATTTVLPAILAAGDVHLHLLAKFGSLRIRTTMGRFKAAATSQLHLDSIHSDRVWTRGCHMKSKPAREEFISAFRYLQRHKTEGCVVHIWNENIPGDCRFLIADISLDDLPF